MIIRPTATCGPDKGISNTLMIRPAATSDTAPVAMNMSTKNPIASQASAILLIFEYAVTRLCLVALA